MKILVDVGHPAHVHFYRVVILALLVVATFIELSYGSPYLGLFFLILTCVVFYSVVFYSGVKEAGFKKGKKVSYLQTALGLFIIAAVILFNFYGNSEIQTLDWMVLLLGFSLVILNAGRFTEIGRFTLYFSVIFLIFYTNLFLVPGKLGIDLPYYYGHYFVTLPVVAVMQNLGFEVSIPAMRLIEVRGIEHTILKIDLACFGWYSLLLITSMVISYSETIEKIRTRRLLFILAILAFTSYLANFLRVAILVYLAYFYGLETMMIVHSHLGWIIFAILLLPIAFFILGKKSPEIKIKKNQSLK